MTTIQMLTVRTNAALSRLASLQRRAEKISSPANNVVRPALRELTDSLEELQVANDQLQEQVAELAQAKTEAAAAQHRFSELLQVLPCASIWTNRAGEITDANPAAASLLNVTRQHLIGRALVLFMADRDAFQDGISELSTGAVWTVDTPGEIRPRERRLRAVTVCGRRLDDGDHLCWFLLEGPHPGATR
jgi:PAS domain-containing protein